MNVTIPAGIRSDKPENTGGLFFFLLLLFEILEDKWNVKTKWAGQSLVQVGPTRSLFI